MRHALWIALVVIALAVIAWWMWVYRAPPAVPAEYQQSVNMAEPTPIPAVRLQAAGAVARGI